MITNMQAYQLAKSTLQAELAIFEGLIKTYPKEHLVNHINAHFQGVNCTIADNKTLCTFFRKLDKDSINRLEHTCLVFGHQIASVSMRSSHNISKDVKYTEFKKDYTSDKWLSILDSFLFIIEQKWDNLIKKEDLPNVIYHVTTEENLGKILKIGLVAKSKSLKGDHPQRTYFALDRESAEHFMLARNVQAPEKYTILEIDTKMLDSNATFYEDPNFKGRGIYTYDNIHPSHISKML